METFTLKEWFLMGGHTIINDDDNDIDNHNDDIQNDIPNSVSITTRQQHQQQRIPRILLLDGGVSTHLEEKIRMDRRKNNITKNNAANTNHSNDNNNNRNTDNNEYIFKYRELWSSSLLLNDIGKNHIYNGHYDWLLYGNVNIITTVTYQTHYIQHLWPIVKQQQNQQQQQDQQQTLLITDSSTNNDTNNTCNENNSSDNHQQLTTTTTTTTAATDSRNDDDESILTKEIVDQMWYDGIALAKQAIHDYRISLSSSSSTSNHNEQQQQQERPMFVVASSGCYGAALSNGAEYTGTYIQPDQNKHEQQQGKEEEQQQQLRNIIYDFHLQKIKAIVQSNININNTTTTNNCPNGIAIETVPSIIECQVLHDLFISNDIQNLFHNDDNNNSNQYPIACYVSLSCQNGTQLNDGSLFKDALRIFHDVSDNVLQAIGLNCCSIQYIPDLLRILVCDIVQYTPHRGIVVYPNSGEIWDGINKTWLTGTGISSCTSTDIAITLMKHIIYHIDMIWDELSTTCPDTYPMLINKRKPSILIGGCCRMTVETIAELRILIDEYNQS